MGVVDQGSESVLVRWPTGEESTLPYLWLRDNCDSPECRVEQTSEKRFLISDVPSDLRPVEIDLVGDELRIVWPGGHRTRYAGTAIRALGKASSSPWTPWDHTFRPRRTDYRSFLGDDATAASAIGGFLEYGALVLTDAPKERGTLEYLSPRLGPIREVLFSRIHDVEVDPSGYNVAHTSLPSAPAQ